jgi:hypothetical protein
LVLDNNVKINLPETKDVDLNEIKPRTISNLTNNKIHELRYSFKARAYSTPTMTEYEKKINKLNVVVELNYCLVLVALTCTIMIYKHYYFLIPISMMFINLVIPITYPILAKINILLIQLIVMILLLLKV